MHVECTAPRLWQIHFSQWDSWFSFISSAVVFRSLKMSLRSRCLRMRKCIPLDTRSPLHRVQSGAPNEERLRPKNEIIETVELIGWLGSKRTTQHQAPKQTEKNSPLSFSPCNFSILFLIFVFAHVWPCLFAIYFAEIPRVASFIICIWSFSSLINFAFSVFLLQFCSCELKVKSTEKSECKCSLARTHHMQRRETTHLNWTSLNLLKKLI